MYLSLAKMMFTSALRSQGEKLLSKLPLSGKDFVRGEIFVALASAVDAIDLTTINQQSIKNTARAFRAAADSLDGHAGDL